MKKILIGIIVIVSIAILFLLLSRFRPDSETNQQTSVTPSPKQNEISTTPVTSTTSSTLSPRPTANIVVRQPTKDETVGRSFIADGSARVFENIVSYRLLHQKTNTIIVQGTTTADSPDTGQFGDFTITVLIPQTYTTLLREDILVLEVFQASAKDGSDADKVIVSLVFTE